MKILGKPLNEYFKVSWKFLAIIFLIAMVIVFLRLSSNIPASIQSLLTLGGIAFIGFAGWSIGKNHEFNLKHVFFVGILLSFGSHWSVPIFHRAEEMLYIILINTIIFFTVTVFGGWLAKKLKKQK